MFPKITIERVGWVGLFAVVVASVAFNVAWHVTHHDPILGAFANLTEFFDQWDEFSAAPAASLWQVLTGYQPGFHRSLLYHITGLTVAAFGFNRYGILLISTVFLVILLCSVFGIVRRLRPGFGPLAAVLAVLSPAAVFWSRVYSPFVMLMATGAFGIYLLVRSERLTRAWPTIAFGLLTALALRLPVEVGDAMQIELSFACCALYVFVLAMWRPVDGRWRPLALSAAALVVFLATVNKPFLLHAFRYTYQEAVLLADTKYAYGSIYADPLATLTHAALLWHHHLGPLLTGATFVGLAVIAWRAKPEDGWGFAYFLAPLIIATLINKKAFYYVFGMLPGTAVVIGLAVGRFKNRFLVAGCFAFLLFALAYTNPWSINNVRVTPAEASDTTEDWYDRYMEFDTRGQARSSARDNPVSSLVDAIVAAGGPGHDVELLFLGNIRSASGNTLLSFLLRLAQTQPHFDFEDGIRDIERACMRSVAPRWYPTPRAEPNVVLIADSPAPHAPGPEQLTDSAFWRGMPHFNSRCFHSPPGSSIDPEAVKQRLIETLANLPWEDFRLRTYSFGDRLLVFDRPDLGIAVQLPTATDFNQPLPGPTP